MGLFDKKFCDVCGEKIGLLGNRKLEDGNLCKDCAKKLSPFFSDRRRSTVAEIKKQLEYREQNKRNLMSFNPTLIYGEDRKIYIDTMQGAFVVSRLSPGSWSEENPDIIPFSQLVSCNLNIREDRDELYTQGKDGERVSYNPPRYEFYYDFDLEFKVNNNYFDEFTVQLNDRRVKDVGTAEYHRFQQMAMEVQNALMPGRAGGMGGAMGGFAPQNGYVPQNAYVQQNAYAPQNAYAQQNAYAPQNGYAQQNAYGQPNNMYAQQNAYAQPGAYGAAPAGAYAQPQQAPQSRSVRCDKCGWQPQIGEPVPKFCPYCGDPIDMSDMV